MPFKYLIERESAFQSERRADATALSGTWLGLSEGSRRRAWLGQRAKES